MSRTTILALILILVGGLVLAYDNITYTTKETVIDIGPIEATREKEETIPLPSILGGIAVAAGALMLLLRRRERPRYTA